MSNIQTFDIGDTVRFAAVFTTTAGVATDPTTVALKLKEPDGAETSYTYAGAAVTKDSTGTYHKDVVVDASGTWHYRWVGTGAVTSAEEGRIVVRKSAFASP